MKEESMIVASRRRNLANWIDENCGGSKARFIDLTGINQGELSALLKNKSFGEKKARSLEKAAGMPDYYLDLVITDEHDNITIIEAKNYSHDTKVKTYTINQYNEIRGAMGVGVLFEDQPGQITSWQVTQEWLNKNIPSNTGAKNLCIITGFGDSMRGMFNPGDPLVVDTGVKECKHDGVYFFRVGDEGFVKRLQRIPHQGIKVISKNPEYESWFITDGMDFEVLGKVLKVWESTEF